MTHLGDRADATAAIRCRDDILQAMYWLRGEDPTGDPDLPKLHRLLVTDLPTLETQLAILVGDGLVEQLDDRFRLTMAGAREGGRRFADEFGDLTRSAHGDCPPDCPHCAGIPRDACEHCLGAEPDGASWAGA
ncbi:MAG: hypothetical protein ACT4OQ_02285 [Chloroflexota bacterium]